MTDPKISPEPGQIWQHKNGQCRTILHVDIRYVHYYDERARRRVLLKGWQSWAKQAQLIDPERQL